MYSVAAGMGLAVISEHALAAHLKDDQVAVLNVAGFPLLSHWWTLYPQGKRVSPVAAEFLRYIDAAAQAWYQQRQRILEG